LPTGKTPNPYLKKPYIQRIYSFEKRGNKGDSQINFPDIRTAGFTPRTHWP
jgi:hypothetical protein